MFALCLSAGLIIGLLDRRALSYAGWLDVTALSLLIMLIVTHPAGPSGVCAHHKVPYFPPQVLHRVPWLPDRVHLFRMIVAAADLFKAVT